MGRLDEDVVSCWVANCLRDRCQREIVAYNTTRAAAVAAWNAGMAELKKGAKRAKRSL